MLVAFSVAPSGTPAGGDPASASPDGSVSAAVADAIRVVRESGLPNRTDAMFTTIEGDWGECLDVVKRACEAVGRARLAGVAGAQGRHPAGLDRRARRQGRPGRGCP